MLQLSEGVTEALGGSTYSYILSQTWKGVRARTLPPSPCLHSLLSPLPLTLPLAVPLLGIPRTPFLPAQPCPGPAITKALGC